MMAVIPAEFLREVGLQIGAWLVVAFGLVAIIARFQDGLFYPWLKVRMSREKLILIKVRTPLKDYYAIGDLDQGILTYTDKNKKGRKLAVPKNSIYRNVGCNCLDVDDEKNCVTLKDFTQVSGHDAEKIQNLFLRTLYKPSVDQKTVKIVLLLLILVLLALAFIIFFLYNLGNQVTALQQVTSSVSAVTGGV